MFIDEGEEVRMLVSYRFFLSCKGGWDEERDWERRTMRMLLGLE